MFPMNDTPVMTGGTTLEMPALWQRINDLEARVAQLESSPAQDTENRLAMIVFSGDLDKAIAAFIIATGAAAMGLEVSMFFTFWGLSIVRKKKNKVYAGKSLLEKGFTAALPGDSLGMGISQMNFFGAGSKVIRKLMRDHEVTSLEEMMSLAQEFGVRLIACDMSRELLGVHEEELMDNMETGGVAAFIGDANRAKITLFV